MANLRAFMILLISSFFRKGTVKSSPHFNEVFEQMSNLVIYLAIAFPLKTFVLPDIQTGEHFQRQLTNAFSTNSGYGNTYCRDR